MNIDTNKFFESSEFYTRRYRNFSTMVIFPVAFLILFIVTFGLFATREVSLKTTGEIQPSQIIADIQSTSSSKITTNKLAENMTIRKGQVLLRYSKTSSEIQMSYLKRQQANLVDRRKQLSILKQGIQSNSFTFSADDNYGYSDQLTNYLSQRSTLQTKTQQSNADIQAQNNKMDEVRNAIQDAASITSKKIADYKEIQRALESDQKGISSDNSLKSVFSKYRQVIQQGSNSNQSRNDALAEVQLTMNQLTDTLASYATQKASAGAYLTTDSSLTTQLESIQTQELVNVAKEDTTIKSKIDELNANIAVRDDELQNTTVLAPKSGILHIDENMKSKSNIGVGSTIAQVYPSLTKDQSIQIVAYVSSQEVASVHKDDWIRFTSRKENADNFTIKCRVTKISTAPERTKKGNFFKIIAKTKVSRTNRKFLQYGLQGAASIITGKKTYFNYYRDKIIK